MRHDEQLLLYENKKKNDPGVSVVWIKKLLYELIGFMDSERKNSY